MNIYEYIKKDHQKVDHLFKQFTKTESKERKLEIVGFIGEELALHLEAEQATFYKALEQYPETRDAVNHGGKEHDDIEKQLNAVLNATSVTAAWEKKVMKLKELVEHHVQEEEGTIHKKAKMVLTDKEALILKENMHECKNYIRTASAAHTGKKTG